MLALKSSDSQGFFPETQLAYETLEQFDDEMYR